MYFDFVCAWDVGAEVALPYTVPYDGVLSVTKIDATTGAGVSVNLAQYTDYFINYQSGADAVVQMTDQSDANLSAIALIAYE